MEELNHVFTCFETENFDQHQFAYEASRSIADDIATVLHTAANHTEKRGNYDRMLFVDFSSAFNTILRNILVKKLTDLDFPPLTCDWINSICAKTYRQLTLSLQHAQVCVRVLCAGKTQHSRSINTTHYD